MKNNINIITFFVAGGMIIGAFLMSRPDQPSEVMIDGENGDLAEFHETFPTVEELRESFDIREWGYVEGNMAGNPDAPVVLIQFSDYACRFCVKFWKEVLPKIKQSFIDKGLVRYVYSDFTVHGGQRAAEATWCASEQGAFWQYHDALYSRYEEDRQRWNLSELHENYARALGLNVDRLLYCFEGRKYKNPVEESTGISGSLGIPGAPFFMINDKVIPGYQEFEIFEEVIKDEIRKSLSEE